MAKPEKRLTADYFEQIAEIGRGGFGEVYLVRGVRAPFKDKEYAMKKIKKNDKSGRIRIELEIDAIKTLSSNNDNAARRIVKFRGTFSDSEYTYIIMDYCKGGSMRDYIKRKGHPLQMCIAANVLGQLVEGVSFMHKLGVTHRDLTAGNVLIDSKEIPTCYEGVNYEFLHVKIADFGLTKRTPIRPSPQTCVGTPGYMAQEVRDRNTYDETADVFSLGAILYFMLLRKDPPPLLQHDKNKMPVFTDSAFFVLREDARDLIQRLMSEKDVRIDLNDIEYHEFMRNGGTEALQVKGVISLPPRSSSVEQRQATSRTSANDNFGARLSAGFGSNNNEVRQSRLPLVERQYAAPHQPQQFRPPDVRRTRPTTGTTGASGDSAFWSGDRRRPSASQCSHRGICVGQRCSCGFLVSQVQRQPSTDRYYNSVEPVPVRRATTAQPRMAYSNGSSNRVSRPTNTPIGAKIVGLDAMSTPSTSSNGTGEQKANQLEWPIPYVGCYARSSKQEYRFSNYTGRYIAYSTDNPSIVFEMFAPINAEECKKELYVKLIFEIHGNNPGNQQRVVIFKPQVTPSELTNPKVKKKIPELDDPLVQKQAQHLYRLRSWSDLEVQNRNNSNLRKGYQYILGFVKLMRRKQWRRRMRNMYGYEGYNMELRYDGTIVMNCPDSRQADIKPDGKSNKLDTLNKVEKMLFDLGSKDLSKAHEAAIYQENNLPLDPALRFKALRLITKPSEIIVASIEKLSVNR